LIPLQIPTAYLEGYGDLKKQVSTLPWPQRPRFIFTSNLHISDDVFKAWAAEKVEAGFPLVIGQHGGLYGSGLWFLLEEHEITVSDRYLSWGWEDGSKNNIKPVGNLKMIGRHPGWDPEGCALMVEMTMPRYSYYMYSVPVASQWLGYFEDQSRFVAALPKNLHGQLLVRLYSQDFGWNQKQRWQERFPQIRIDDGTVPIASLIEKSRLVISTYNSTTFLESLVVNTPTIMFWNPKHWELRASARCYFDRLKNIGIFHETPESAAAKMTEVWDDVPGWWHQPEIQEARLYFCNRFARMPKNPLRVLEDALTTVKPKGLN
jgi:putative transferase (TIGR04331 family)